MSNPGLSPDARGKVRDIYDLGDRLMLVASDRISAFDHVLAEPIPHKGEVLTKMSIFWFEQVLHDVVPNHLISADIADLPEEFAEHAEWLAGRFMIVKKAQVFPVECIVRGYLAGGGWNEYRETGAISGVELPQGLLESAKLDEPIFTPSTKAEIGSHDENITYDQMVELIGETDAAELKRLSLEVYERARTHAAHRGIIIADTKFEFGKIGDEIILVDEVLTPDSSRFWHAVAYEPGRSQPSFDKQYVRDWLESTGWDKQSTPPALPADVIENTSDKYVKAYQMITTQWFQPEGKGVQRG